MRKNAPEIIVIKSNLGELWISWIQKRHKLTKKDVNEIIAQSVTDRVSEAEAKRIVKERYQEAFQRVLTFFDE